MTKILSYFPGTPRDVQAQALLEIEKHWDDADVFLVSMAVGSGKSRTSFTIARWAKAQKHSRSVILTPTKILTDQYAAEFNRLHIMRGQADYLCDYVENRDPDAPPYTCKDIKQLRGKLCDSKNCCYLKAMKQSFKVPYSVANYYTYMAQKMYRDVVLFDEGHQVIDMVRDFNSKTLWRHDYQFPGWVRTYGTLERWLEEHPRGRVDAKLKLLGEELSRGKRNSIVVRELKDYRGEERECLSLKPVDVSDAHPLLWPQGKVGKLVFLSGTMNWQDVRNLGLDKRRVHVIDLPSPIPAERRPVQLYPLGSFSHVAQERNIPKLAEFLIQKVLPYNRGKGLIHAPYGMAALLRPHLESNGRFIFHDKEDKKEKYQEFRERQDNCVLLGSGLYEGIDLAGEDYQWQVITKVPYPSLAEPAIKYRAQEDPVSYQWDTLKTVLQACGRICRGADDFGKTLLVDTSFERLYNQGREANLLPRWWLDSFSFITDIGEFNDKKNPSYTWSRGWRP